MGIAVYLASCSKCLYKWNFASAFTPEIISFQVFTVFPFEVELIDLKASSKGPNEQILSKALTKSKQNFNSSIAKRSRISF